MFVDHSILDRDKINLFILDDNFKIVFQVPYFYKIFQGVKNYEPHIFTIKNSENKIIGTLLFLIQKEQSGFLGSFSSRSIIMGGPIVKKNNLDALQLLLKEYNSFIKNKVVYSQFRNLHSFSQEEKLVFKKNGFEYVPHLNIIHSLRQPIEKQWMFLHKGRRKNIRRAEKAGLSFTEIQNKKELKKAYNLIKDTYQKIKLPLIDKMIFNNSYLILGEKGILKVFVAVYKNEIIATRMVLCFNNLIYDWYAGASVLHLDKYPNDFLVWKVLEWGTKNGYHNFDFGGAGKPTVNYGVRDYKIKFGGDLVEFGRFEKVHKPLLMILGKIGLKIYKYMK